MRTFARTGAVLACLLAVAVPVAAASSASATPLDRARAVVLRAGAVAARNDVRGFCRLVGQANTVGKYSYTITHVSYRDCHEALFTTFIDRFKRGQFAAMGVALKSAGHDLLAKRVAAGEYDFTAIDGATGVTASLDVDLYHGQWFILSLNDSGPGYFLGFPF